MPRISRPTKQRMKRLGYIGVTEAAKVAGCSFSALYKLIRSQQMRTKRQMGVTFVALADVRALRDGRLG